jgi:hypothetical protein
MLEMRTSASSIRNNHRSDISKVIGVSSAGILHNNVHVMAHSAICAHTMLPVLFLDSSASVLQEVHDIWQKNPDF